MGRISPRPPLNELRRITWKRKWDMKRKLGVCRDVQVLVLLVLRTLHDRSILPHHNSISSGYLGLVVECVVRTPVARLMIEAVS